MRRGFALAPAGLRGLAVVVAAGLGGCTAAPAPSAGSCRTEQVAELGARLVDGLLVVPVELDGQSAEFAVDTAAGASLITPEAARRLGLREDPRQTAIMRGVGGKFISPVAELHRFAVGSATRDARSILVGSLPISGQSHVDGILGADWLGNFEVEVDVPQSRLGLWRAEGCGAGFDPMAGPHFALPVLRASSGHVLVPVRLDGAGMFAFLDSGATITDVSIAAAHLVGVSPAALAQDPAGTGRGADLHPIVFHLHRFAELSIGPEHYRGITLKVSEAQIPVAGVLLGADYLAHHRVWISRVVPKVFIAPVR